MLYLNSRVVVYWCYALYDMMQLKNLSCLNYPVILTSTLVI